MRVKNILGADVKDINHNKQKKHKKKKKKHKNASIYKNTIKKQKIIYDVMSTYGVHKQKENEYFVKQRAKTSWKKSRNKLALTKNLRIKNKKG